MSKKSEAFSNTFISVLAVLLAVVITFSVVMTAQTFAETAKQNNQVVVNPQVQQETDNDSIITDDSTVSDIGGVDEPTDIIVSDTPTEDEEKPDEKDETAGAFASTEELVVYFNTCANKVKTESTKVVKNFEKRSVGDIVMPSILQSTAETMMNKYMADDTEPIVYATKQEIRDNFIVPNQDYVSCLKASDVAKADYKDNGKEYVIYLKIKDEKNPRAGSGVGAVCDVIETHEIADKAGALIKEFTTEYYNCEITATIDKETGRMVHAVYKTPLKMLMVVNMFGTHNVGASITFTKDYTITY
ncbi:MAG: hypothetical protein IJB72_00040 [Clostridia bacterium]|nr:hypothetical protein [Clostridia bacterium]